MFILIPAVSLLVSSGNKFEFPGFHYHFYQLETFKIPTPATKIFLYKVQISHYLIAYWTFLPGSLPQALVPKFKIVRLNKPSSPSLVCRFFPYFPFVLPQCNLPEFILKQKIKQLHLGFEVCSPFKDSIKSTLVWFF